MNDIAIFTIASRNYFALAKTFLDSVKKAHPSGVSLYLFLADEGGDVLAGEDVPFQIVEAKDLPIPNFKQMAFQYDIMEFNTAIKPFCFSYLFCKGHAKAVYFDPDIMVFRPLNLVFSQLDSSAMVLTPHITEPLAESDQFHPSEQVYLRVGTYNLGFIAVSGNNEGKRFIDWWGRKCAEECFKEMETGLFVDQKWVNLALGFFTDINICRDKGLNMAYWNLHERKLGSDLMVNGEFPLIFYHFSGINITAPDDISSHQNRYSLTTRTDLAGIFRSYCDTVLKNGYAKYCSLPYAYASYQDGGKIGDFARRHYSTVAQHYPDPFMSGSGTYKEYLKRNKLLESPPSVKPTVAGFSKKIKKANFVLKAMCRIIGIDRYNNLMLYLRNMAVIRKQDFWS